MTTEHGGHTRCGTSTEIAVAVLTEAQLEALVERAVTRALAATRDVPSDWVTRAEAAKILRVHPAVITRYVQSRGLPGTKIGREWRFRRSELDAWLIAHAHKGRK